MKNPNLIFAITSILLLFFGMVSGQDTHSKPDKAARLTTAMQKRLQLNDTQLAQVSKINQETTSTLQNTRSQTYESRQDQVAAVRGIWKNHGDQLKQVLDENQWTEFVKMRQEMKERMQKKRRSKFRRGHLRGRRGNFRHSTNTSTNSTSTEGLTEQELEELGTMDLFDGLDDDF